MLLKFLLRLFIVTAAIVLGAAYWRADAEALQREADESVRERVLRMRNFVRVSHLGAMGYGDAVFPDGNAITQKVIASDAIPQGLFGRDEAILGQRGERVRIDGDRTSFWIVYTGVDYAACVRAASSADADWVEIGVNDSPMVGTGSRRAGPLRAAQHCRESGDNKMIWRAK